MFVSGVVHQETFYFIRLWKHKKEVWGGGMLKDSKTIHLEFRLIQSNISRHCLLIKDDGDLARFPRHHFDGEAMLWNIKLYQSIRKLRKKIPSDKIKSLPIVPKHYTLSGVSFILQFSRCPQFPALSKNCQKYKNLIILL